LKAEPVIQKGVERSDGKLRGKREKRGQWGKEGKDESGLSLEVGAGQTEVKTGNCPPSRSKSDRGGERTGPKEGRVPGSQFQGQMGFNSTLKRGDNGCFHGSGLDFRKIRTGKRGTGSRVTLM